MRPSKDGPLMTSHPTNATRRNNFSTICLSFSFFPIYYNNHINRTRNVFSIFFPWKGTLTLALGMGMGGGPFRTKNLKKLQKSETSQKISENLDKNH